MSGFAPVDYNDCASELNRCITGPNIGTIYNKNQPCEDGYGFDSGDCGCSWEGPLGPEAPARYGAIEICRTGERSGDNACVTETWPAPYFDSHGRSIMVEFGTYGSTGLIHDVTPEGYAPWGSALTAYRKLSCSGAADRIGAGVTKVYYRDGEEINRQSLNLYGPLKSCYIEVTSVSYTYKSIG